MRLCRFRRGDHVVVGLYGEDRVVPLFAAATAYEEATHEQLQMSESDDLLDYLPPDGPHFAAARKVADWVARSGSSFPARLAIPTRDVQLLVPIPRPNKLFLLAGNYVEHIKEGGGKATTRTETFPYVFLKPASTTLTDPGAPVVIPKISPHAIDWECELAVVIGQRVKGIKEADALRVVAGYTVVNDISDRKFRPNPGRTLREKDAFFDWLHGKWADSFCPCGPCITSADAISDPQQLEIKLSVNGELKQDGSTAQQIFPVAAVIEFLASYITLEPGDIISTGTPAGVGNATGTYLKPGDVVAASVSQIGTLVSPVKADT
jgi:2-keto-4-pentenoate hydratase/2-oxohepta-3-ene-1,7-dioic acid hydratase in catechol pathway